MLFGFYNSYNILMSIFVVVIKYIVQYYTYIVCQGSLVVTRLVFEQKDQGFGGVKRLLLTTTLLDSGWARVFSNSSYHSSYIPCNLNMAVA